MKTETILIAVGLGLVAYLLYENLFKADAAPQTGLPNQNARALPGGFNSDMGGLDFGALDPSNWDTN